MKAIEDVLKYEKMLNASGINESASSVRTLVDGAICTDDLIEKLFAYIHELEIQFNEKEPDCDDCNKCEDCTDVADACNDCDKVDKDEKCVECVQDQTCPKCGEVF